MKRRYIASIYLEITINEQYVEADIRERLKLVNTPAHQMIELINDECNENINDLMHEVVCDIERDRHDMTFRVIKGDFARYEDIVTGKKDV